MRRTLNSILVLVGALLIVAGQYTLTYFDAVAQFLGGRIGDTGRALMCAMPDLLPCGVPLGLLAVGLGALLVAVAIGLPPGPPDPGLTAAPALGAHPRTRKWVVGPIVVALVLAALGSALSIRTQPGNWPLWLWLATFLLPIPAMMSLDRTHGTPFRDPFPQHWEWLTLLLIVGLDLLLVGHDMTSWRWAGTPDEADFFGVAAHIAAGTSERALLSEGGVFSFQPVLSSYYPALFMMAFGTNAFAWKLSSAVALAGSLPFIYLFTRELWNRRTAFMATLFFGSAQLAVGFSHFGYNNVQVYPIIAGGLGMLAWARTRRSLLGYYIAGCIAGVGFYTYYTARVVAPLLFLLIWSCDGFPLARKARAHTLALALGLGLTILPVFSDLATMLSNMLHLATPDASVSRMLTHWFMSLGHGLWYPGPHHFQSNPIEDPISAAFMVIGFWLCIGGWRRANGRFLALAYLLSAFLVGATSQHPRPPLTRLLFLAPLTAILAAVGADQVLRVIDGHTRARQGMARVAACVLVIASVVWNIATVESDVRSRHGYANGATSELIRLAQQLPKECRIILIEPAEAEERLVPAVMEEYGMEDRFDYRRGVDDPTIKMLRTLPPPLVVFTNLTDPQQLATLEATMTERFPAGMWRASDPGELWNLRYFDVTGASLGPPS